MELELDFVDGVTELDGGAWDALVEGASPFLEYGFLSALEETGCVGDESGWQPQILVARRDGELVGALPLYLKMHSHGEYVFDWAWANAAQRAGLSYYPKAVVAVPFTPIQGRRLLVAPEADGARGIKRALVEEALEFADDAGLSSVHFNFVAPDEVEIFEEFDLPVRYGMQYHWYNGADLGQGDAYGDFDDFLARFRSKKRSNIKRERRKLREADVTTEVLTGEAIEQDHLDRMFDYYRDTIEKYFWGRQYLNRDFFLRIGETLSERLHMVVAEQDGEEFAGAFNLYDERGVYGRYWGCRREVDFAHFEVCLYRPVEWCIDHGLPRFEPGAQGEHKYDRGFMPTITRSAHYVRHPGLERAVRDFIAQERRDIEREVEAMREDSPYKG